MSNPYKQENRGRKDPGTYYIVWYGDREYYRSDISHHDARRVYKALVKECENTGDTTPVCLVKIKLVQKILSSTVHETEEDIQESPDQEVEFNFVV